MNEDFLKFINKNKVAALIPARSGSKGIKNKNLYPLCGYPLIAYSIAVASLSTHIDRVIVSTDSPEYAAVAKQYGAEVPFLRPKQLAGDHARDIEFVEHAIQWLYDNESSIPGYFVHLRPTNPIRSAEIIDQAVVTFQNSMDATSLRSAHRASHTPYKWFRKTDDGFYYRSILDGLSNDEINNPRQGFQDVFEPDGYVDILNTEYIVRSGLMHGDKMVAFESPDGFDIDTVEDLAYLEYIMTKNPPDILKYLQKHYPL